MKGKFRRSGIAAIGVLALVSINLSSYASAHAPANVCALAETALPAVINNVEGKGAPWTVTANAWTGSSGPDGDPMIAQRDDPATTLVETEDGFGHAGQGLTLGRRGLYYPVNDPNSAHLTPSLNPAPFPSLPSFVGDHFNWTNNAACDNSGALIATKGVGVGYCGRSVGLGFGTTGGHNVTTKWESTASQLYLTDLTALGTVNAQPNPPGSINGSCLAGTAVTFLLNGVIAHS